MKQETCLYYLWLGWIIFAEGDAVQVNSEYYCFRTRECLAIVGTPAKYMRLYEWLFAKPDLWRIRKAAVQATSNATDEAVLLEMRSQLAGLQVLPPVEDEKP